MSTEPTPPTTAATAPTAPTTAPTAPAAPPEPKAEPNALATALSTGWEQFTKGELISYRAMAVTLVVAAVVGTTIYITRSNFKVESGRWTEFDGLSGSASVSSLEEFAKKNPDTVQARLAEVETARALLGPEGIERFSLTDPARRKEAIDNVEKARDSFLKLADAYKDDPIMKAVCLRGAAKGEAALVGMPKDGAPDQYRGDPAKAAEYLDKLAEAVPDTEWSKDAKKLAESLRSNPRQVIDLQDRAYAMPKPIDPGLAPKSPIDNPFGAGLPGLPGGP
ncbi:hypothetical protein R5W23_000977 [Gemmata sp. JC673]|uniref:Tetratricopeptide repeat-like domain-containing protein n=1 Tax=Gemmata algarum TaxID=2975278 RepID=A0ABU5EWZ2_9BACT|nr:hypothetical protein [Gemmata algarum]MDY3559807.1 hypothetical protein [Gemmata algarum]